MSDTFVPGRSFWTQRTGAQSHGLELKWVADGKVPGSWQTWAQGRQQEPPGTEAAPLLAGPCRVLFCAPQSIFPVSVGRPALSASPCPGGRGCLVLQPLGRPALRPSS